MGWWGAEWREGQAERKEGSTPPLAAEAAAAVDMQERRGGGKARERRGRSRTSRKGSGRDRSM
jgi:hypothetical protein